MSVQMLSNSRKTLIENYVGTYNIFSLLDILKNNNI